MIEELELLMSEMWAEITAPRDEDGDIIRFDLKQGQHQYLYWGYKRWMFCYTPWKSTKGWYYAFNYHAKGSGKDKTWKLRDRVKFRKRKLAKQRAYNRYIKMK